MSDNSLATENSSLNNLQVIGTTSVFIACDIAQSINLNLAQTLLKASLTNPLSTREKTPPHRGFDTLPLTLNLPISSIRVGTFESNSVVETTLFDFGAISFRFSLPLQGTLEDLQQLSVALYENSSFEKACNDLLTSLLPQISPSLEKGSLSPLREDYILFEVQETIPSHHSSEIIEKQRDILVGIIAGDTDPLSTKRSESLFLRALSYGKNDFLFIDWHAALLLRYTDSDVRRVIEFANVELLELRFLDKKLDVALNEAYNLISKPTLSFFRLGALQRDVQRLARHEVDGAVLFEGINDALKLFPDQHLAQVYQHWTETFALPSLDSSISRKLSALESVYRKMSDQLSQKRMELLEVIIILLFVISLLKG